MIINSTPKRCAVYTRVSNDERLGQSFNSLDAQKESAVAFIRSQSSEGWVAVADDYCDGGFSGGNMERPALKRLLTDVEKRKIDVIVFYKIDRLSRNLSDFSRMIELFDKHGVSFSSVTQQINSATAMGKLMLNVLMSFASFEREIASERIRDKVAASKAKGIYMGGVPPLGFDVQERMLIINNAEAALINRIFENMITIGSTALISKQLNEEGVTTKAWTTKKNMYRPGGKIDKKYLHRLLRNRIYRGEIQHKGTWYKGQHQAIVSLELWSEVQAILAVDSRERSAATKIRGTTPALLRGLLYTPDGEKMLPTYTRRRGKVYRYYLSKSENKFGADAKTFARLPADLIESAVMAQVKQAIAAPETVQAVSNIVQGDHTCLSKLSNAWELLFPAEQHRIVNLLIERIDLKQDGLEITWHKMGWRELVGEFNPALLAEYI